MLFDREPGVPDAEGFGVTCFFFFTRNPQDGFLDDPACTEISSGILTLVL